MELVDIDAAATRQLPTNDILNRIALAHLLTEMLTFAKGVSLAGTEAMHETIAALIKKLNIPLPTGASFAMTLRGELRKFDFAGLYESRNTWIVIFSTKPILNGSVEGRYVVVFTKHKDTLRWICFPRLDTPGVLLLRYAEVFEPGMIGL